MHKNENARIAGSNTKKYKYTLKLDTKFDYLYWHRIGLKVKKSTVLMEFSQGWEVYSRWQLNRFKTLVTPSTQTLHLLPEYSVRFIKFVVMSTCNQVSLDYEKQQGLPIGAYITSNYFVTEYEVQLYIAQRHGWQAKF